MLAANNSMGPPPTLLTVNGIISGPQIPPPGMMNGPHSGVSRPNLNSHLFTPTFYPQNTAFTSFSPVPFCGAGSQLLPCITPSNGTLFTQGPTNPFSFNTNGSMMVSQPQSFVNFSPFNQNNSSTTTVVLAAPDICNNSGAGSVLPPCFSPLYTNLQPISSSAPILPVFSVSGSSNGLLTMPITHSIESPVPLTCATPLPKISEAITPVALKCKVEVPNSKLMTSTTSSGGNTNGSANMIVLENAEFHRGIILEAIDKLRERKARPDSERISRLLRLQHNISRIETQLCLSRLAETGSIVCVDYKGNLSYRNPSKWRKTAASTAGVMNLPSISRRLVEAIHCLAAEPDASMCQGVTLFQIESVIQNQQLQNLNSSGDSESRVNALTASVVPDLSGPTLRVCLEREATYGKLAKLHDGRYILDENGERKRSQGVGVNNQFTSPLLLNKKPIPHNGKICGNTNQMIGGGYGKPPIAPAIDSNLKLTSPKTPGMINIAPGINGRTLALRRPPNPGKRGRPLGTKSKKIVPAPSQPHILPAPMENGLLSEKRTKLENIGITPQSTISGFVPINIKSEYVPLSLPQMNPCQMPPCLSTVGPTGPMVFPGIYNMTHTNVFALSNDPLTANRFQDPDSSCLSDASFSMAPQMQSTAPLEHTILQTLNADDEVFSIEEIDETIETSRKVYVPEGAGCCRCQDPETQEERFLICKNCGLQAHPKCLDFWPEVTERARQEAWQCADCKSCSVCKDKNAEEVIFICDACDKGFHGACHAPPVSPEADQNLPWVCSTCQAEGYRVQLPTTLMSEPRPLSFDKPPPNESLQSNNVITPPKSLSPPKEISLVTPCVKTTHPGISTSQPQTPAVVDEYSKRSSSSYDPMILSNSIDTSDIGLSEIPASDTLIRDENVQVDTKAQSIDRESIVASKLAAIEFSDFERIRETNYTSTTPQPRSDDVRSWSVNQVSDWLIEQGFIKEADSFLQQDIDGACLMLLKRMDVLTDVGIKLGPAVKIFERIKRLQSACLSISDV